MQILFKTSYDQDIDHLPHRAELLRVGLALALAIAAPLLVGSYILSQLGLLMVYAIAGVGLMMLTGFTGQVSFGHAAFLGLGAYAHAILMSKGVPFGLALPCAVAISTVIGAVLGRSASKMHGFYLAIATLVFAVLFETLLGEWEGMTGGYAGMFVPAFELFGLDFGSGWRQYYVDLAFLVVVLLAAANVLRGPTGRAFVAIRDSELSARCLGVDIARTKILSFALSAGITGLAGALLAHHLQYLSPETFSVMESLRLLLMIVVGGLGTLLGPILGATFIMILPLIIRGMRDLLPSAISEQAGLEPLVFGLIIVLFILFEPTGMAGRWTKIRRFIETFPYYRADSFERQKRYVKTERMR
ncbi:branched-chain amino acid ABC transporter permease [Oceanibacterium hippocampi]|uniref:Leucine/isoleucine/valine transporter permease subunit n=1 Tax=Oceanibacterium hippocampi TaxID=745714 RepID=A0A1Y5SRQ0_9PROT|nr:branched-chain amino acid ABC transporter permease [Oceanibacterium hippocampi]SLN46676.1 leucine/isoleucine/valine transporter permease subunit [Oceanibacterium hippocampi]